MKEAGSHVPPTPHKHAYPLRVRVLSGCSCLQGNDVVCVCIPSPHLLCFFLSLLVDLAAPASSQDKRTPLHAVAQKGHAEVAMVLLAAGANVHATSNVSGEGWGMRLDYRDGVPYMKGVSSLFESSLPLLSPLRARPPHFTGRRPVGMWRWQRSCWRPARTSTTRTK
jgi:hypothetical protein